VCKPLAIEKGIGLEWNLLIKYREQLYNPVLMIGGADRELEGECPKSTLRTRKVTLLCVERNQKGHSTYEWAYTGA